jgi:sugar lactone lactonase YvrE
MRPRTTFAATVLALAVAALSFAPAAQAAPSSVPDPSHLQSAWVATIPPGPSVWGSFGESMASDGHGNLIVSATQWGEEQPDGSWTDNVGLLWLVGPHGSVSRFGPAIPLGGCAQLEGVTVDEHGSVYIILDTTWVDPSCGAQYDSGVLRVTPTSTSRVLTIPAGSWPNGIAVHDGIVYVTDSLAGAIWRGPVWRATAPAAPWFTSPLLTPVDDGVAPYAGANGIAFRDGAMYVVSTKQGLILRISVGRNGSPTGARVWAKDPLLIFADGIDFDSIGRAWVTNEGSAGSLLVVSPAGHVRVAPTPPGSLDFPTQAVVGPRGTVYVVNGSYYAGTPNVTAFTS